MVCSDITCAFRLWTWQSCVCRCSVKSLSCMANGQMLCHKVTQYYNQHNFPINAIREIMITRALLFEIGAVKFFLHFTHTVLVIFGIIFASVCTQHIYSIRYTKKNSFLSLYPGRRLPLICKITIRYDELNLNNLIIFSQRFIDWLAAWQKTTTIYLFIYLFPRKKLHSLLFLFPKKVIQWEITDRLIDNERNCFLKFRYIVRNTENIE